MGNEDWLSQQKRMTLDLWRLSRKISELKQSPKERGAFDVLFFGISIIKK